MACLRRKILQNRMKFWKLCVFWKIYHGIRIFNFHVLIIFIESMEERSASYKLQKSFIVMFKPSVNQHLGWI